MLDEAEDQVSDVGGTVVKNTQLEQQKEKRILKNDNSLMDMWDNIKSTNFQTTGVPEGEDRRKQTVNLLEEIMMENLPTLVNETYIKIQEVQSPKQDKPRGPHQDVS